MHVCVLSRTCGFVNETAIRVWPIPRWAAGCVHAAYPSTLTRRVVRGDGKPMLSETEEEMSVSEFTRKGKQCTITTSPLLFLPYLLIEATCSDGVRVYFPGPYVEIQAGEKKPIPMPAGR